MNYEFLSVSFLTADTIASFYDKEDIYLHYASLVQTF